MTTTEEIEMTETEGGFVPSERMLALFADMGAAVGGVGPEVRQENADLLRSLRTARVFLKHTLRGITDEQARTRTTASKLTLGGLLQHVTATEAQWARFLDVGAQAMESDEEGRQDYADGFEMGASTTVAELVARYDEVAATTDALVASLPDLDVDHLLPEAPWFPPGSRWSARRVVAHLVAETAQHSGHADILRESLDGARTMG